jgi:hypothetical protein
MTRSTMRIAPITIQIYGEASTIQIVRHCESTADTQSKLQPALLRLSAIYSQYFTRLMA